MGKDLEYFLSSINEINQINTELHNLNLFHPHTFNKTDIFNEGEARIYLNIKAESKYITSKLKRFLNNNKNQTRKLKIIATDKDTQLKKVFSEETLYESLVFLYKVNDVFNTLKREIEKNV